MRYNGSVSRRQTSRSRKQSSYLPWLIGGGVILVFIVFVAVLARQPRTARGGDARVGDHWHALLTIELCGQTLPPLPPSPGDVHTHGDGVIHIHPASPATAGRNASLAAFFRTTPVQITATSIAVGGARYADGGTCPDGKAGALTVLVRRKGASAFRPERDFLRYLPRDGDEIRVVFGP